MAGSNEAKAGAADEPAGVDPKGTAPVAAARARSPAVWRGWLLTAGRAAPLGMALVAGAVLGTTFGLLAAPRAPSDTHLTRIEAGLEAGRGETARLGAGVADLARTLADLREATEAGRRADAAGHAATLAAGTALDARLTRLEQDLERRLAVLERAPAATASPTPAIAARPEPMQTGSLPESRKVETKAETKTEARAETLETWALREVYDGVAMLEDRKRRLVEVAPGDSVPGVGRVEAIERRGRTWVVVTRQGVIAPQAW